MRNLYRTLLVLFALCTAIYSCSTSKQVAQPPPQVGTVTKEVVTIKETVHDTLFLVPADTAKYQAQLDVSDKGIVSVGKVINTAKPTATNTTTRATKAPAVQLTANNLLNITCFCDSLGIYYQYKQHDTTTVSKEVITLPPVEVEKKFTFWQKVQLWLGRILILILLLVAILSYFRLNAISKPFN